MDLQQLIKPELYIIVPVLYIIGYVIKNSVKIDDRYIPLILCGIGILISLIYILASSENYSFRSVMGMAFSSITQGFLCAGAAVLTNQLKKQHGKEKDKE